MRKLLSSAVAAIAVAASLAGAAQAQPWRGPVPALRVEVRPPIPHRGWVWRPGYWNWAGGRYVWVGGVWAAPGPALGYGYAPGYTHWVPGHWTPRGRWVPPHWAP